MEGHQNAKSYSSYKSAEYGKRSSGDITAVKPKQIKRERNRLSEESARRRSQRNSANSEVNKVSTPSIEIPYYTPGRSTNSDKDTALPLVNFKISNYSSTVTTSDSNKSCGIPRKTTIKRSVDLILKSSRNSESCKQPSSKEIKMDQTRFHSKSLTFPRKSGYTTLNQPTYVKTNRIAKTTVKLIKPHN